MYISQQQVEDEFTAPRLRDALDDDGDGQADEGLLDRIIAAAQLAVDGFLGGRYLTPFTGAVPPLVADATLVFVCEKIHDRRRQSPEEKNPYRERADAYRDRLKRIADRQESLDAAERPAFTPGAVLSTPSALNGSSL
jgi:phage gp36-like protein